MPTPDAKPKPSAISQASNRKGTKTFSGYQLPVTSRRLPIAKSKRLQQSEKLSG